jgi:hypothetical protein
MRLPIVWPGAADAAITLGKRLVRFGARVRVELPGAFVWCGFDHALRDGVFVPTCRAWGRGEEPLITLEEHDRFDPIAGLDEADTFEA